MQLGVGSDYPHPEGLRDPLTDVDHLDELSDEEFRKVVGGNLSALVDERTSAVPAQSAGLCVPPRVRAASSSWPRCSPPYSVPPD